MIKKMNYLYLSVLAFMGACICAGQSAINFYTDGTINTSTETTSVNAWNNSDVTMTDGTITSLDTFNSSSVTIQNGTIDQGTSFWNQSRGTVTGGQFNLFFEVHNSTVVNVYGGSFDGWIYATDASIVYLHAYDVVFQSQAGRWNGGQVSGRWLDDDSSFTLELLDNLDAGEITYDNIVVIPEPATGVLLALGGLALRRRKQ